MVFDAPSDYAILSFALLHIFENQRFQSNDIIMHREPEEPSRVTDSRQIR